jgi:hypothetical protein
LSRAVREELVTRNVARSTELPEWHRGRRFAWLVVVELWRFESQTSCMPSAGNPSTGVHRRRSPSCSVHSSPSGPGRLRYFRAVLPRRSAGVHRRCGTSRPRGSRLPLHETISGQIPDAATVPRHRTGRGTCQLRSLPRNGSYPSADASAVATWSF